MDHFYFSNNILFDFPNSGLQIEIRGNAHAAIHLRTINQFLKLVYLRKITANILFMYIVMLVDRVLTWEILEGNILLLNDSSRSLLT